MNRDDLDTLLQLPHSAGRAFVRRMVGFLRSLRENGFAVGLGEGRDALRIAAALDLSRPRQLRAALKPLLATRREEAQRFDAVFDAYWLRRGVKHVQPASVGAGMVSARVIVVKSSSRYFNVTVRPRTPWARSRAATL